MTQSDYEAAEYLMNNLKDVGFVPSRRDFRFAYHTPYDREKVERGIKKFGLWGIRNINVIYLKTTLMKDGRFNHIWELKLEN